MAMLLLAFALFAAPIYGAQDGGAKQLIQEGLSLYKQGKLDEAFAKLQMAMRENPSSEDALQAIEEVGFALLIQMVSEKHDKLPQAARELMQLTATEVRKRQSDAADIAAALEGYFGSDNIVEYTRILHHSITVHGVYLTPGLVERLGSAEAATRTKSILALKALSDDAVVPLCRALQHSDAIVVQGICAALKHIQNPAAIPSLLRIAQTTDDEVARGRAKEAITRLGGDPAASAYDALVAQGRRFYLDSSYMHRSYHDPVSWSIVDGKLAATAVHSWAVNELNAAQFINDAARSFHTGR